ncbi:hypothetical protein ACIBL3_06235 [Kribbella sp. NPDC050124]|uniref:hypothetical protein n=1 Tax=Kribbella sp. NPDC050124 TaxID=3364114 RepID=UPI0037B89AFB
MAVLGIVLIVLAVLFGLGVLVTSGASTTMEVFGVDFGVSVATVFVLGALAGATLIFGLWLTKKGLGRGYRRRKEMRDLRAQVTESDTPESRPELTTDRDEAPTAEPAAAAERTATEERPTSEEPTTIDPGQTKQPH